MFVLIFLGILSLIAIIATIVTVGRDGYRARPTIADRGYLPPDIPTAQPVVLLRLA